MTGCLPSSCQGSQSHADVRYDGPGVVDLLDLDTVDRRSVCAPSGETGEDSGGGEGRAGPRS